MTDLLNNVGGFYGSINFIAVVFNIIFTYSYYRILAVQFFVKVFEKFLKNE
jgi:hypothetical protein